MLLNTLFVSLLGAVTATVHASSHGHARDHHDIAKRMLVSESGEGELMKRGSSRWTVFNDGLGACGSWNKPGDFIVALNAPQYGGGENCGKKITMTYNGKTATATIMDECPECPWGALDLSFGLWNYFTDHAAPGIVYGNWNFGDSGAPPPPPPPPPKSKTTHKAPPPPTSTKKPTEPTSSSSSSSHSASSTSSVLSINYSSGVAAGLAVPTGGVSNLIDSSKNPSVLADFNQAIIDIGGVLAAAKKSQ